MSNPNGPEQNYPQYPRSASQPPYGSQYPPPSPYAHHPVGDPYELHQRPAPKSKNNTVLKSIAGIVLAMALVVVTGLFFLNGSRGGPARGAQHGASAGPGAALSNRSPHGPGDQNLLGKSGEELRPVMPTETDFPQGTKVQPFIDSPGEANGDDRLKPPPPEATNPPGCWTHLEIRKNRDDFPDITRIITTQATVAVPDKNGNPQDRTVAAAQISKENNNVDALGQAKTWLGQCQEFDYVYRLKEGQPPIHFKLTPLPGPAGFSDPFFGVQFEELGPQGPLGYRYFFAARVRGLLVLSEGVCDLSYCDENQNLRIKQQIPVMFSKVVQGLRNMQ